MIRKKFRDLSFRKKCFVACLLVSMIPVTILGVFCYRQLRVILTDRENTALRDTLLREGTSLEEKFSRFVQSIHYVCWNNNLTQSLRRDFEHVSQMYLFYRDTLDPLLGSTSALNPEISNITIYTDISIYPHGTSLRPLTEVAEDEWFDTVCADYLDHWFVSPEKKTLFLASRIYGLPEGKTALVKMDFLYDSSFASMQSLYENNYGILLTDATGKNLYEFHSEDLEPDILSAEEILGGQKGYVVESVSDLVDGWTVYLYRPMDTLLLSAREMATLIWVIISFCLLFVVLVSSFLSAGIVRPLELLTARMKQADPEIPPRLTGDISGDEIGSLTEAFNQMSDRLNVLVQQLIQEKVLQKEYELRALQAQINPHFLYNSLSLINSKAILADQMEISQMSQFLSTFYRTTLNKGKSITTVREELENIRSYINIQLLMHSASFKVVYNVAEGLLDCAMPNLLLQPLVENAIVHGIDCISTERTGQLGISGFREGKTMVFRVSDNGPGISPEKMDKILTEGAGDGYGVQNVHRRVQMLCGSAYGLSYKSDPGRGTTVTLTLPIE